MSCTGKSTKTRTSTKTVNGKTTTTVVVEDTFKYSDGRQETKTREMVVEGPPPSKRQINDFIHAEDDNEDDFKKLSISSNGNPKIGLKANDNGPTTPAASPDEYAKQALEKHNELRKKHGVPPLTCAADLCAKAQKWADYLLANNKMGHSPKEDRSNIGENIAYMQGSSPNLDYPAKEATESWYSEIKDYHYYGKEPPPFGSGPAYGHFTQVVWKDTKEMGIGRARGNGCVVVVGNYRPAGNFIGNYKDNVFPPK